MARSERLLVRGLHVSPNPHSAAPEGALGRCDNVLLDRPGSARPRPGFKKHASTNNSIVGYRLFPWNGGIMRINSATTSWASAPTTGITDENSAALTWDGGAYSYATAAARKNLYLATADGVRKLTSTSDVVASQSGVLNIPVINNFTVASGTLLPQNYYCSYRAVLARTDANGVVVRSASCGIAQIRNQAAGDRDVNVSVYFDDVWTVTGDVIELYRSPTSDTEPDDEHYLCKQYTLTSGDITAKYVTILDSVSDEQLGAALYTNDSREGVDGNNYAPPKCRSMAHFNRSLFFGNTVSPKRITLSYKDGVSRTGKASTPAVGYIAVSGTRTNGSATITLSPANTSGELKAGMMLLDATSWGGTAPVTISSGNLTSSITMSETWGGSTDGAPVTIYLSDVIHIGTTQGGGWPIAWTGLFLQAFNSGYAAARVSANTTFQAYAIGSYMKDSGGGGPLESDGRVIVIEERKRGDSTARYIQATHGTLYRYQSGTSQGALPEPHTSTTVEVVADTLKNHVWWSKADEPEHVTLAAYQPVGSETAAILRMLPTRAALWIFKEDGLFRLSGSTAPYWSVESYDPTIRLLRPDAAVVSNDAIYAWTSRGVIELSDGGSRIISTQIGSDLDAYQRYHTANSRLGVWMAEEPTLRIILLGISPTSSTETSEVIYCYHVATGEWSRWTSDNGLTALYHMAYDPASTTLIGTRGDGEIVQQRLLTDSPAYTTADFSHSITITGTPTTAITISGGSGWTPVVGDAVVQSSTAYVVTAVASATSFTVNASGLTAASATAYEAFSSTLEWLPVGSPLQDRAWSQAGVGFETQAGLNGLSLTWATERKRSGTAVTKSITYTQPDATSTEAQRPTSVRVLAPRSAALGSRQFPKLVITNALGTWRLSGLGLSFDDLSTRVSR